MTITLGEYLRKSREEKGLNLAEAAYQTKIRENYLYALENDQPENLPSKVHGRGYLRLYAQFLDLDENLLLLAFDHPEKLVILEEIFPIEIKINDQTESDVSNDQKIADVSTDQDLFSQSDEKIIHGSAEKEVEFLEEPERPQTLSQKIFTEIGNKLRKQRELLNFTKEEIEQFTSIRPYYLEALEKGDFEKLPSIPQARGMLNNYATFLNLDIDQIMIEFADGLQTRRNESYAPHKIGSENQLAYQAPQIKKAGWFKFITADLLLTSGLIIALFLFILWGAANISGFQNKKAKTANEAPSISDVLLENTPVSEEIVNVPDVMSTATIPVSAVQEIENEEGDLISEETSQVSGLPVQVYIIARQRAYLKVDVDGKTVFVGRTIPGNAYDFSGSSTVEILTGNAAALEIYYNLVPVGVIGDLGEVKSLVFSTSMGLITPTPGPTQTALPTQQPSPTSTPSVTPTLIPPTPTPSVTPLIP